MSLVQLHWYTLVEMRVLPLLLALAACKSGGSQKGAGFDDVNYHTALADDDGGEPPPTAYDKSDVQKALIAERGAEAKAEQHVTELEDAGDPDPINAAEADLAVRRRFIATPGVANGALVRREYIWCGSRGIECAVPVASKFQCARVLRRSNRCELFGGRPRMDC